MYSCSVASLSLLCCVVTVFGPVVAQHRTFPLKEFQQHGTFPLRTQEVPKNPTPNYAKVPGNEKEYPNEKVEFQCPQGYGIFADPADCRRFYRCNDFVPYGTSCPTPLLFDDARKVCVYRTKGLQCGPLKTTAPLCVPTQCHLPDCFCSEDGTKIPGNLSPPETPQLILLTFSGALNALNAEPFDRLLSQSKLNHNGCRIKATFFLHHENTSYFYVQKLYGDGHEIGMQSITNRQPEDFWSSASVDDWAQEVIGMKEILHRFANISRDDLSGMRAPFLKTGGNNQLSMMRNHGLTYDCSLVTPLTEVPLWPYTLDYHIPHECTKDNCVTKSFPGIWQIPLDTFAPDDAGGSCVFLDDCVFDGREAIFHAFRTRLERNYEQNRAPLVLNMKMDWATDEVKFDALDLFLEHVLKTYPYAWFVTMKQAVQYMRHPVSANSLPNFQDWWCPTTGNPGCAEPRTCTMKLLNGNRSDIRYAELCGKCPEHYPWLKNPLGA